MLRLLNQMERPIKAGSPVNVFNRSPLRAVAVWSGSGDLIWQRSRFNSIKAVKLGSTQSNPTTTQRKNIYPVRSTKINQVTSIEMRKRGRSRAFCFFPFVLLQSASTWKGGKPEVPKKRAERVRRWRIFFRCKEEFLRASLPLTGLHRTSSPIRVGIE